MGFKTAKVVTIPKGKFTHPYSCNLGAKVAKGRYLTYINGHSIPVTESWLEDGDWANHWIDRGYILVHDPKFRTYHSHNWGLVSLVKQYFDWRKLGNPSKIR